MGDREPVIIIISSDEDEGSGETKPAGYRRRGTESWDSSDDDDDDCVILEYDDCVILEEDPDKPVQVVNKKLSNDSDYSDDSDDLIVVSEKGQVACRDYPHPRHLCVKFPFATTPHESHCDKCHCYVCDTLAPCLYWTKDDALTHCNATDKMWVWRNQRENRKKSDEKVEPNRSPHHLQHKNTNSSSTSPTLTSRHIASEFNNLNLGPANTDMNSQTLSNPHTTLFVSKSKKNGKTWRP
ncbi:PREDICTED: uncharacterized protein LOC109182548 isoform X2 [Ipomoea nil]|uniref:uncharacterized protein LOC109182548 isoform X2 n=1 Tax=Ipomoea nil TaxID=35883 RepID=UPI000900B59C|nr:PREDICTED: uncharacterized protein LOC109182548 isoform X2 [Ipomoea nil]